MYNESNNQSKNLLQSVLHRNHIVPPAEKLYHPNNRAWWLALKLAPGDDLRVRQELVMLDQLDILIDETSDELQRLSLADPWRAHLPYLIQLPGIGLTTGLVVLSAIGDISRFSSAKKLVGYIDFLSQSRILGGLGSACFFFRHRFHLLLSILRSHYLTLHFIGV